MYPDAKYPDFIYDAAEAVAWTNKNMTDLFGCKNLYVGGSSAGGYLSMMLCFDKKYLASVGLDNSVIVGYLHDAGQPTAHFNVLKHSGIDRRRIIVDESAPLYYVGIESDYPRMRFIVSDTI
jgi:acetyl esterase/lipase